MFLTLLILSIALFCWSVWQSGHLPEHNYEEEQKLDQKTEAATKVIAELIDDNYNNDDEDPPTVVMVKR